MCEMTGSAGIKAILLRQAFNSLFKVLSDCESEHFCYKKQLAFVSGLLEWLSGKITTASGLSEGPDEPKIHPPRKTSYSP